MSIWCLENYDTDLNFICSLKSESQRRSVQVPFSVTNEGFSHKLYHKHLRLSFINISLVLALCVASNIFLSTLLTKDLYELGFGV